MSVFVLTDGAAYLGSAVISPYLDGFAEITGETEMVEYKRLDGGGFRHYLPSLSTFRTSLAGAVGFDTGEIGETLIAAKGQQYALSIVPENGSSQTAGDTAIIHRGLVSSVKTPTGPIGSLAMHSFGMTSDLVQTVGVVAAPHATYTTAGLTGTAIEMTGPAAGQSLYAALHVTDAAGTDLAVKIQSDDNGSFTTATDRITFSTVSAVGWQFLSVAGDLSTETHWRAVITVASSTFDAGLFMGVA